MMKVSHADKKYGHLKHRIRTMAKSITSNKIGCELGFHPSTIDRLCDAWGFDVYKKKGKYEVYVPKIRFMAETMRPFDIAKELGLHHSIVSRIAERYNFDFPHKIIRSAPVRKRPAYNPMITGRW